MKRLQKEETTKRSCFICAIAVLQLWNTQVKLQSVAQSQCIRQRNLHEYDRDTLAKEGLLRMKERKQAASIVDGSLIPMYNFLVEYLTRGCLTAIDDGVGAVERR